MISELTGLMKQVRRVPVPGQRLANAEYIKGAQITAPYAEQGGQDGSKALNRFHGGHGNIYRRKMINCAPACGRGLITGTHLHAARGGVFWLWWGNRHSFAQLSSNASPFPLPLPPPHPPPTPSPHLHHHPCHLLNCIPQSSQTSSIAATYPITRRRSCNGRPLAQTRRHQRHRQQGSPTHGRHIVRRVAKGYSYAAYG
jgi:hypothetical protein